jgi:putative transposase
MAPAATSCLPRQATLGVRATQPNELWHIDATVLKLVDGTRAYIHAVIDNYSRKILAWTVAARLDPAATCQVLVAAKRHLEPAHAVAAQETADGPLVYSDSGVENVNRLVQATLLDEGLHLVLAQVHVAFSNSMIEAFWRSLIYNWLYLHPLDSLDHLRKLVAFFVDEHNRNMPHSAFRGQTRTKCTRAQGPA